MQPTVGASYIHPCRAHHSTWSALSCSTSHAPHPFSFLSSLNLTAQEWYQASTASYSPCLGSCFPGCYSVAKSCLTHDLMDCSMPGFPVLHYLLEFAQTQVHGWLKLMSWWCHQTISSAVAPFSSCPQSFTFIKRLFSSSSLSAIRVATSAYLRLLIFLPAILIPACDSCSLTFLMMYSA